ncbi:MAG: hypothetical protein QHH24_06905 [Candidatus Bathyarchaeota archaeon]|nr:hypothetical protein [Candidatus Bathyarchaeota archaeon]
MELREESLKQIIEFLEDYELILTKDKRKVKLDENARQLLLQPSSS